MHPAYSIIFFTVASGAGYGLLGLLGVLVPLGVVPGKFTLALGGPFLAFGLISAGLISSAAHLGRPERAWRAFSQWRSSWLSREGVLAIATYVPALVFAAGWIALGHTGGWVAVAGTLAAIGSVLTVGATAMIYASLKPVPRWNSAYTLPSYLLMAIMSGLALLAALVRLLAGDVPVSLVAAALVTTLSCWALRRSAWRDGDRIPLPASANSATGLAGGTVRSIEWPHSEANFLLKEMGYQIARKHAGRLRVIAQTAGFVLPAILYCLVLALPASAVAALPLAAAFQLAGLLVERWLFFAEARHMVMLYYG